MGHTLAVGAAVFTQAERIARRDVKFADGVAAGVVGQSRLAGVIPFEDAVRGDATIEDVGQYGHLQVFGIGNETTAVAPPFRTGGERDHVSALEFETVYLVVEFLRAEGIHETTAVLQTESIDGFSLEMGFGVNGKGMDVTGVGHNDAAPVVNLYLTVHVLRGTFSVDLDVL